MDNLGFGLIILAGLISVGVLVYILVLLLVQLKIVNRLTETNKQLLFLVAGKEAKPEALRALIASEKLPKKTIPGIADKKNKDDKKPKNTDYTMSIGV